MRYRTTTRALLVTALAAAALLLTGCEPAEVTDKTSQTDTVQCDPNGFGPLKGCDGVDDNTGEDTFQDCHTLVVGCKGDHPETLNTPLISPDAHYEPRVPMGEDGLTPASCPQDPDVFITEDWNGHVERVERYTYDGTPDNPSNVQAHPIQVSQACIDDYNRESDDYTTWFNNELDKQGGAP